MTQKKRNLFTELMEGVDALAAEREGKRTLRAHTVTVPSPAVVTGPEVLALRRRLNVSRAVLAARLRTNPRTLENWEQGRAKPNAQAALLIRLVARYPETMERLAAV
jgi:putative transcriptional regulator